ncbi:hypothetical protein [Aeromicrobium stalagmiti]|uniref:hypothetical protein n=1 Tax=Aeromicrobium stalagmiti TaxID=2738988 RepID=UPI0015680DF5|nr:hypothetical protein [Aeromicrobium stalagmiti]NRQ48337.1 hypothetical protein [Aeromicrobium stalagmiti]
MKSRWVTILAGVIAVVVTLSVAIGLSSPDGVVAGAGDDSPSARPSGTPQASATTTAPATAEPEETADRAPLDVKGTWPGRPDGTTASGPTVDWCPAVRTTGAAEAEQVFGAEATDAAACAAVRFMFEQRYSRLSLPRTSYAAGDFDFVLPALTAATAQTYSPRIDRFVSSPGDRTAADDLGLVLLRADDGGGADHALAGEGRVFYGPAFTTRGYRQRAAWINPTWSKVAIRVDRSKSQPRIVATFTASAAVPVFDTDDDTDDMMTVPTSASLFLRQEGSDWRIGGWTTMRTGTVEFGALELR